MSTTLVSAWIIGFVIKSEPLPTGAMRLTLDNGQIGIVENPQNVKLSYLLEPSKQDGFDNRGVAFKKSQQDIITEIRKARIRVRIRAGWRQASSSLVLSFHRHHGNEADKQQLLQETYLAVSALPTPTPYELLSWLPDFSNFSHIAEDAAKNGKPVDFVVGNHPLEIIHIQYSQSAFKNPPGKLHRFSDED